jgi:DNA-binding CsgD family transcriptional regulator
MSTGIEREPAARIRGRDDELGEIRGRLLALSQGRGSVAIVEGAPGIGKTRLLGEAVAAATRLGIVVHAGSAGRDDVDVPMSTLLDVLTGAPEPVLDPMSAGDGRGARNVQSLLITELGRVLEGRDPRDGPLLFVVDDLQWADPQSVTAIEAVAALLAPEPISWLMAVRPQEASAELTSTLGRLEAAGGSRTVLRPLSESAVARLIWDLAGAPPDDGLMELAASADGTPFLLTELVLGLRDEGLLDVTDDRAAARAQRLPMRMRLTMRDRLGGMSPGTRDVATGAAALGHHFSFDGLAGMLHVPPSALVGPVDDLVRAGLIVEEGDALAFRHDILREAVLDSLPASARAPVLRQAVQVLLAAGALPVEVADQLADSAQPGDSEAIDVLSQAAKALGTSDPSAAADLAKRILELTPLDDPRRGPLVADVVVFLHASGRATEATDFADVTLRALLPHEQESEIRFGIAGMFSLSPDLRAEASQRALDLPGLAPWDRARHLARLEHNLLAAGRLSEAQGLLAEVTHEVDAHGDEATIFSLGLASGGLDYCEGDFDSALQKIEAAVREGSVEGEDARARIARQWRTEVLASLDRFDDAVQLAVEGFDTARRESQAWAIQLWQQWRGRQYFQLGQFEEAIAELEGRFRPGEGPAGFGANDAAAISALAGSALRTGDRGLARRCAEFATRMLAEGTPELQRHASWVLAQQAAAAGDPRAGQRILARLAKRFPEGEPLLPCFPLDVGDETQLVRIALAAGDPNLAESAVALAAARAARNPDVHTVAGAAMHASGLLHADADVLRGAVQQFERSPRRPLLASALEDAAVLAPREEAIELLGRALELCAEMGAAWDATRLRRRLRDLGVRRRLTASGRPTRGWEALTGSETAVVEAVVGGMTNREAAAHLFLSPHTVSTHIRHVFEKLSINSRVELARIAAEMRSEEVLNRN